MAGYSGTPLSKKLGIKQNFKLYVKNAPEHYRELLSPLPEKVSLTKRLSNELDMVHFFTTNKREFVSEIPKLVCRIKQEGMIWVSWPKKASKVVTDVTEDVIREVILPLGLVDIKVCAVDDVWSGLKLVIRKELRNS